MVVAHASQYACLLLHESIHVASYRAYHLVHLLPLDPGTHVQACSLASEVRIPVL